MSKSFDEIMKIIEESGAIPDEKAQAIIAEHGPLSDEEKKQVAATLRMKRAMGAQPGKAADAPEDVSLDDYIQALSVLDSDEATADEKKKAEAIKNKFESQ